MPETTDPVIHVTLWNEFIHEQKDDAVKSIYPDGMHRVWRQALEEHLGKRVTVREAHLSQPEHGLSEAVLEATDVLFWWGHIAHDQVDDAIIERVAERVLRGMGLVALHSTHFSKLFRRLMGTSCRLNWRNGTDRELVWTVNPSHPIARGVEIPIQIPGQEMYGEYFDIPQPEELVFISSFSGGEVFRSGCCFQRGFGRIFYFSPGDQEYPVYHHPGVKQVLANAAEWVAPTKILKAPYMTDFSPTDWFANK
jgi:trehalose utilization protein